VTLHSIAVRLSAIRVTLRKRLGTFRLRIHRRLAQADTTLRSSCLQDPCSPDSRQTHLPQLHFGQFHGENWVGHVMPQQLTRFTKITLLTFTCKPPFPIFHWTFRLAFLGPGCGDSRDDRWAGSKSGQQHRATQIDHLINIDFVPCARCTLGQEQCCEAVFHSPRSVRRLI
jgi:hypothetical protein